MAENPLLPHAELRRLHASLKQCLLLDRTAARKRLGRASGRGAAKAEPLGAREALLAGTALQLQAGDLLVAEPGDAVAATFGSTKNKSGEATGLPELPRTSSRLLIAASMAAALRASGTDRFVLAYARAGAGDPDWQTALSWAQEHRLPLVLACADARGPAAFTASARSRPGALEWGAVGRLTAKLQLPVLSVDGEDAVAVYRVMQESALRARTGAGPAVLWAMLPHPRSLRAPRPRAQQPLQRLERYLRTRKISF